MLSGGQVHFVASDAHGSSWRPPDLGEAYAEIASRWGQQTAWKLCLANPQAVISDRPLAGGAA